MYYKNKNVLVTGGSGFVGTNLIKRLLEEGANVTTTFHRKKPQIDFNYNCNNFKYYWCDLTNSSDCEKVCKDQDFVFMCAANTSGALVIQNKPLTHVTPNIVMNSLMMEAAYNANVKKFLFISSNTVYPDVDFAVKEEDFNGEFFHKYFCVASMKRFSEVLCEMYSLKIKNPMITIVIRPGNLYGEYDDFEWETSHSTASLIRKVVERQNPIEVWGDGTDSKDLMYISDFIDGLLKSMEVLKEFTILNIASGKAYSIKETLNIILKTDGYENPLISFDPSKPTMISKRLINIDKAKNLLGFSPKFSIEEGIKETLKWYKENK